MAAGEGRRGPSGSLSAGRIRGVVGVGGVGRTSAAGRASAVLVGVWGVDWVIGVDEHRLDPPDPGLPHVMNLDHPGQNLNLTILVIPDVES